MRRDQTRRKGKRQRTEEALRTYREGEAPAYAVMKEGIMEEDWLATVHGYADNRVTCEQLIAPYNKDANLSTLPGRYFCKNPGAGGRSVRGSPDTVRPPRRGPAAAGCGSRASRSSCSGPQGSRPNRPAAADGRRRQAYRRCFRLIAAPPVRNPALQLGQFIGLGVLADDADRLPRQANAPLPSCPRPRPWPLGRLLGRQMADPEGDRLILRVRRDLAGEGDCRAHPLVEGRCHQFAVWLRDGNSPPMTVWKG